MSRKPTKHIIAYLDFLGTTNRIENEKDSGLNGGLFVLTIEQFGRLISSGLPDLENTQMDGATKSKTRRHSSMAPHPTAQHGGCDATGRLCNFSPSVGSRRNSSLRAFRFCPLDSRLRGTNSTPRSTRLRRHLPHQTRFHPPPKRLFR